MNEPSVFSADELTMPKNTWHYSDLDKGFVMHRDLHNAYGIMMAKATY